MAVAAVSGITVLEQADEPTDGTIISGGTSPTAPINDTDQGMQTTFSSGFRFPFEHNITNGSSRYGGKRFTFSSTDITNKFVLFGAGFAAKKSTYYNLLGDSVPATITIAEPIIGTGDFNTSGTVHLGTRFTLPVNGTIYGLRWYKHPLMGTVRHFNLYTSGGSLLANISFDPKTQGTVNGWQEILFSSGVSVTSGTTYSSQVKDIAETTFSYSGDPAKQAYLPAYFATSSNVSKAMNRGTITAGGYYHYNPANSAFANSSYSEFYWMDIIYLPTGSSPSTFYYYPRLEALASKANRGFVFRVNSTAGTNYREGVMAWYPAGDVVYDTPIDLNTGIDPWSVFVVDYTQLTQTGTFNPAATVSVEFQATATDLRTLRIFINKIAVSSGLVLTGGTSPDAAGSFKDFAEYSRTPGIWVGHSNSGQYYFILPLQIGNGSTATRLDRPLRP